MKKLVKKVVDGEIVEVEEEVMDLDVDLDVDSDADPDVGPDADPDVDPDADPDEVEAWMANEGEQQLSDVPVSTHIRVKQKLKGRLSENKAEIEDLKRENAALKATKIPSAQKLPERPLEQDFDTIQEFNDALVKYDDEALDIRLKASSKKTELINGQAAAQSKLNADVDAHFERAAKLVQDNKLDVDVYKKADTAVREAIESVRPGQGDLITEQVISMMGEGSEKVLYFLGRTKNALSEFISLLESDISGLKASIFLGKQQERLLNSKRKKSAAPPPGSDALGDQNNSPGKEKAFLKKRKAAIKAGDIQLAYDIKKAAKAASIDVSNW